MRNSVYIVGVLVLLSSCATTLPDPIPCPPRPILESFTIQELDSMGIESQEKIVTNQIRLKAYAMKLEARARCDDT